MTLAARHTRREMVAEEEYTFGKEANTGAVCPFGEEKLQFPGILNTQANGEAFALGEWRKMI